MSTFAKLTIVIAVFVVDGLRDGHTTEPHRQRHRGLGGRVVV
jgi:hypothetical protein